MFIGWLTCISAVLLPHSLCRSTTANAPANRQMPIASVVSGKCKKIKKKEMSDKKLIETAFVELKKSTKGYLSIKDISLVKELNDNEYTRKAHFILFGSKYFRSHASTAIAFSEFGLDVSSNFDTIEQYEKSLKKRDYAKTISIGTTIGMFVLGILTYCSNSENKELKQEIKYKEHIIDSLKNSYEKSQINITENNQLK